MDLDMMITGKLETIWNMFNEFGGEMIAAASDCPFNG